MLQDSWDEFLSHKHDQDSDGHLKKFLKGVQAIEEVHVKDTLSQLSDPVSVGELVCKQLLSRFACLKSNWMIHGLPGDVRLLLAAVDRFSQAGFVYNSRVCDNLLSMLDIFTKAALTHPSDVVLPLPSYRLSSLWHAQGHWSSVARFVVQLKLNQCSQTDDVSDSWMDGLVMLSVLEGILANTVRQPSRGKQRGELVQRSVNKLMELFTWMVFKQSADMKFKEKRVRSPSPDIDEPDVDAKSPVAPFRESFMSVTLLVLSALAGLLLKHYDAAVELRPLLKQLLQCITGVAKSANAHLEDLLSRPESSLVGNVNECLTYINNAFLCIASCLSLNFCINEQLCSTLSAEFVMDCLEKAGMFEALVSCITHASVLSSLPALPEARQTVLPLLSKLIRLSFMFLPKVSYHQEETEDRKTKKGAQVKQAQVTTVADMLTSPLVRLRPRLVDVLLMLVENSSSQHVQTHILSELSMRHYRSLVTLPHVLSACLKNFSNFHSSAQGIVLQFLHNCMLDNTYVASCADKSRGFKFYLHAITELSPSVAVQMFNHLQSLAGRCLPAVVNGIILSVVLPLLSQFDSSGLTDVHSHRHMSMTDIQQGGKEHLIKGAFSLLVQSLDTLSVREQCSCIQMITLERFRCFLSVVSVQSDCLKVLGHFAVEWKCGVDEDNEYWIRTVHDNTVKLLFDLSLSDVTLSHSMVIELDRLDYNTVQLYAAIGSHVASLLWESDFLFQCFREVSGPVVVAGQAARMLTALSSCLTDKTDQQADADVFDADQTMVAQSDMPCHWYIIFSYIEAQLKLMSRSSQCTFVNYNSDTIGIIRHYQEALIHLVCQYQSGVGRLCNLLLDLAIASFPDQSESDDPVIPADEECKGDDNHNNRMVEMEAASSGTMARLSSTQSGDFIMDDSLSSSCDCSNDSELGWSGYAADISFSECEIEASGRDHRVSFGPSGSPLLFPQLTPLVVRCLARTCRESINCHAVACRALQRLTSIAQSSAWNLHLLTKEKLLQAVVTEFEFIFAGEENRESGLTEAVLSLLTTLARNNIDNMTSCKLLHIVSKPDSHKMLLISSLINMLQSHHVPSFGVILGRGLLCQVGSNVINTKKSPDGVYGSITLPLKSISWIPASVGFSLSLWLQVEQQRCLLYHETEWTEWLNEHRGTRVRNKSSSRGKKVSLQSEFEDQDDAAAVMIMSCGVDRCKFQVQAVQRKGSLNAGLVSRWSGKHSYITSPDALSLGVWHHLVVTVSACEINEQSHVSNVCVYVDGKVVGNHRIGCPRAAMQGTPVTCCIGGSSVQGVSLQVKNEPERMKMKLPVVTNTRSLLLSSGSFCLCKGMLSEDEVGLIYSSGPDSFKLTSSCHDWLVLDSPTVAISGRSMPLDVLVKEKLEVLYCPTYRLTTFYQFHLPQEIERMPSALAVFFHTTQRPMPRTLAIEPTAVKASVSPDVRLARWMGFNGGIHHVGGIASILVLLAKMVGTGDTSIEIQSLATQLLLDLQKKDKVLKSDFMDLGGYCLLRRILCCPSYMFGMETLKVLFDAMCDTVVIKADELTVEGYAVSTDGQAKVIDIDLLHDLLLDNTIWMKCDEPTLNMLFTGLSSLIGAECQHCDSNKEAFINAHVVELILHNCHEREVQSQRSLPPSVAGIVVTLISSLMSPPNSTILTEICNFLVAAHRSPAVRRTQVETTDVQMLSERIDAVSRPQTSTPRQRRRRTDHHSSISSHLCQSSSDPESLHRSSSVVPVRKKLSDNTDSQLDQSLNFVDWNDSVSTYSEAMDTLFSWQCVIGTPHSVTEYTACEYDNALLSTGLLATFRGQLVNLPDSLVKEVLEENFDPKLLLPLADHPSEMQRAAVLKILNIYFTRGRNVVLGKFLAIHGFHLLANQIGYHQCTLDILFMCINLFLGCPAITSVESLDNLDIIAESADCHVESFVLLVTILDTATFGSDIIHAVCLAIGKLLLSVPDLCNVAESDGLVRVVCSLMAKYSNMLENGDSDVIMDVFGDLKQLTQSIVMSCCWSGHLQMFTEFLSVLFLQTSNPNVNQVSTQLLYTLLYHVIVVAFEAFRVPGSGSLLSDKSKISFMEKRSFSKKMKTFQQVCKESIDLIIFSMWNIGHTDADRAEMSVDGNTVSAVSEPGEKTVSAEGEAFARVVLGILTEAMTAIVNSTSVHSAEGPQDWIQLVQSSETVIRVQFGRLLCHLLSPKVPLMLRHSVLSQLEVTHLKNILASVYTTSVGKKVAIRLLRCLQSLFEEDPSLKCARDPDSKTVATKMVEQIMKTNVMQKKLSVENIFAEPLPSNFWSLAKMDAHSLKKDAAARMSWKLGQKEIVKRLRNQIETKRKEIAMHADSVTDDVFELQSTLKAQMMGKIKARQMAELLLTSVWRRIVISTTHERTPLFEEAAAAKHWQLDPTEGPDRIRKRLQPSFITIGEEFYVKDRRIQDPCESSLMYLFDERQFSPEELPIENKVLGKPDILQSCFSCLYIVPGSCASGELLFYENEHMYFVVEKELADLNVTKMLPGDAKTSTVLWTYDMIVEVHRRRYQLMDNGLEIFLLNGKMHFFSFLDTEDRNRVHHTLLSHRLPNFVNYEDEAKGSFLKFSVTRKWQEGLMTNFQYLMHLNKMAGRTFNDLMQYPVFPYILADYKSEKLDLSSPRTFRDLSKPVSVQDESKIEKYVTNYEFLEGEYNRASEEEKDTVVSVPYHYGSHFSNSGIVLHYLVRILPYTKMFLDYQDKHFDVPDRTFHNMESTWRLVSSESPSDVKEMIPEFYYLPEFLVNLEGFDFGERQTGEQVNNVLLPPWAHDDERLFILKHRQALECEYVSRNLHKWIDLVFGYKQTGPAAIEAINVFHPSTYFGAVDIESITDEVHRKAVKAQIQSYGQSPKQLFDSSHAARTSTSHLSFFTSGPDHFDVLDGCDKSHPIFNTLGTATNSAHDFKDKWCQFAFLGSLVRCSVGVLWSKTFSGAVGSLHLLPSGDIDALSPKMASIQLSGEGSKGDGQRGAVSWGFYDGSVRIRVKGSSEMYLPYWPQSRLITCCGVPKNRQLLLFGDNHGVVTVWTLQVDTKSATGLSVCGRYTLLPGHQTAILCLAVCRDFSIWVTGSRGGDCIIWDLNRLSYIRSMPSQSKPVSSIAISSTLGDIAVAYDGHDSQTQSELLVWSINAAFVSRCNLGSVRVNCLAYSSAAEGVNINVVAAGTDLGKIRIFSSWDLTPLFDVACAEINRPIISVMFSKDSWELYGATTEGCVVVWKSHHM